MKADQLKKIAEADQKARAEAMVRLGTAGLVHGRKSTSGAAAEKAAAISEGEGKGKGSEPDAELKPDLVSDAELAAMLPTTVYIPAADLSRYETFILRLPLLNPILPAALLKGCGLD